MRERIRQHPHDQDHEEPKPRVSRRARPSGRDRGLVRRRTSAGVALVVSAALLASACTSGESDGPDGDDGASDQSTPAARAYPGLPEEISQQRLEWDHCDEPSAAQGGGSAPGELADGTPWQCAELTVPLDYDEPEGDTIPIALVRAASSTDDADGTRSLIFNFGGPGGSGVWALPLLSEEYEELRAGYDLVSFDPRGVGESAGVVCWEDADSDRADQESGAVPTSAAELEKAEELRLEYITACEENSGAVLPHLTTANTARDLDLLRHVLGDSQLHYFGVSYGTELGGVYAHHFPENVGRAVFDAVVDPTAEAVDRALHQTAGFQLALENYMADCAEEYGAACPTGTEGGAEGTGILVDFLAELAEEPLATPDPDRDLTEQLAMLGIVGMLYSEETWQYLTLGLTSAMNAGDGELLLAFADSYNVRDESGRYANQQHANMAISCADSSGGRDPDAVDEYRAAFEEASPLFGPSLVWSLQSCDGWPVEAGQDNPEVSAPGAAEILLIGTTGDPATPVEGAERMRDALGEGVGVLLTYDGEGHGAYGQDGCIDEAVNDYLLEGMVPQDGLVCG